MKKRLLGALSSIPFTALAMSGSYAAGCPYGVLNCPYPGQCPRYVDLNGNGLCDLSIDEVNTQTTDTSDGSDPSGSPADTTSVDYNDSNSSAVADPGTDFGSDQVSDGINYHVLPISLILISLYFFTHYLFKKGVLKQKKHRRIWNSLLTMGFIGTGVTGILLTFMINLGISLVYRQSITYWHVELAILMVICTLIHFHIYRKPFKNMFKVLFNFRADKNE